jgi:hypothetical protein
MMVDCELIEAIIAVAMNGQIAVDPSREGSPWLRVLRD